MQPQASILEFGCIIPQFPKSVKDNKVSLRFCNFKALQTQRNQHLGPLQKAPESTSKNKSHRAPILVEALFDARVRFAEAINQPGKIEVGARTKQPLDELTTFDRDGNDRSTNAKRCRFNYCGNIRDYRDGNLVESNLDLLPSVTWSFTTSLHPGICLFRNLARTESICLRHRGHELKS